jgi:hypothetical protein
MAVKTLWRAGENPRGILGPTDTLQEKSRNANNFHSTQHNAPDGEYRVSGVFRNLHISGDDDGLIDTQLKEKEVK